MRTLIVAFCSLISLSLSAQTFIVRGQDTIASTSNQRTYLIDLFNDLSPENLHYITTQYVDNKFSFKDEEDLRSTMSSYLNNGLVVVSWRLTNNERSLLKKYKKSELENYKKSEIEDWKKKELEDWKRNESLTTIREVDNSETTTAVDNNNSTTAGEHLRKAGRYKNTSIAILIGSGTAAGALILADPIAATVIGTVGSLASLALNIAGNMELIAAGRALDSKP